jgi:hypothetical protein
MSEVKVLAFALFIVAQAVSQDGPRVFSYAAPAEWKANPFASLTPGLAARQDVLQMFPYPVPEDGPSSSPEQAQCGFADGKTITVKYSTRHVRDQQDMPPYGDVWRTVFNDIIFVTDESLITVKGMVVPAGDYTIAVTNPIPWVFLGKLVMKSRNGGELRVPLSATKLASPTETSAISFDHTGGSCMMHVNEKNWNTQLSVEFTEKNADLPVAN